MKFITQIEIFYILCCILSIICTSIYWTNLVLNNEEDISQDIDEDRYLLRIDFLMLFGALVPLYNAVQFVQIMTDYIQNRKTYQTFIPGFIAKVIRYRHYSVVKIWNREFNIYRFRQYNNSPESSN